MNFPAKAAEFVNRLNEIIGRLTAWLVVLMVGLTLYDVAMRYLFRSGSVGLQELEWHLFALIILFGAGYTFKHDDHVRVDLIYASNRLSDRQRLLIDVAGNLFFLLPFATLIIWSSVPFAYESFVHAEISPDPGGLSQRWLLKAAIPAGFALLALQALADTVKGVGELRRAG
jgi:TRAP-type mannitol/chloroaromatic compound transport system permease small subunit